MENQKLEAKVVDYCPTCTMPHEYCEFSKKACGKTQKPKEEGEKSEELVNQNN